MMLIYRYVHAGFRICARYKVIFKLNSCWHMHQVPQPPSLDTETCPQGKWLQLTLPIVEGEASKGLPYDFIGSLI